MTTPARIRALALVALGSALTLIILTGFRAWRVDAVTADESTFVPVTPCRLVDTRPSTQTGPRSTPIGPDEEYSLQVTGDPECAIPSAATAVSINLVGVSPTADTFVAVYPDDASNPGTAALNLVANQGPEPNKIDVELGPSGKVKIFNKFGRVHVVGDVMGYYRHDGLADLEQRLAALEATQPFALSDWRESESLSNTRSIVATVSMTAPADGEITAASTTNAVESVAGDGVACSITTGSSLDSTHTQWWKSPGGSADRAQLAGVRTFAVTAGTKLTVNLVCLHTGGLGLSTIEDTVLSAIFTP